MIELQQTVLLLMMWACTIFIHSLLSNKVWHIAAMSVVTATFIVISVGFENGPEQAFVTGRVMFAATTGFLLFRLYKTRPIKRESKEVLP